MEKDYYLSNSEAQTWKRCRRKWWLAYYRKLKSIHTDLAGKSASGTRVHETLAHWYVPDRPDNLDLLSILHGYHVRDSNIIAQEIMTMIAQYGLQLDIDVLDARMKEFESAASYERAMIGGYTQWLEETGVDAELEVISAETPLVSPFTNISIDDENTTVYTVGIVDAVVRRILDGQLMLIDHKTTATLTQPLQTLHMNEQVLHYMHLISNQPDSDPDSGMYWALWNLIKRVKRTGNAKPPFFSRVPVQHSIQEMSAYILHLYGVARDILTVTKKLDYQHNPQFLVYPSVRPECTWDCPFFSICHMFDDGSHVEEMITAKYVQCNPLERYKDALESRESNDQ